MTQKLTPEMELTRHTAEMNAQSRAVKTGDSLEDARVYYGLARDGAVPAWCLPQAMPAEKPAGKPQGPRVLKACTYLDRDTLTAWEDLAQKERCSLSSFIKRAVESYLTNKKDS